MYSGGVVRKGWGGDEEGRGVVGLGEEGCVGIEVFGMLELVSLGNASSLYYINIHTLRYWYLYHTSESRRSVLIG